MVQRTDGASAGGAVRMGAARRRRARSGPYAASAERTENETGDANDGAANDADSQLFRWSAEQLYHLDRAERLRLAGMNVAARQVISSAMILPRYARPEQLILLANHLELSLP